MKRILLSVIVAVVLSGCDNTRNDSQTYRGQGKSIELHGTLTKSNELVIKMDGMTVIAEKMTLSTNNTFYFAKGEYQQLPVSVFCTISSFSTTTTFCTVSLDSKEIAILRFK